MASEKTAKTDNDDPTPPDEKSDLEKSVEAKVKALEKKADKVLEDASKLVESETQALEKEVDKDLAAVEKFVESKTKGMGKGVAKVVAAGEKLANAKVKALEEKLDKEVAAGEKLAKDELKSLEDKLDKVIAKGKEALHKVLAGKVPGKVPGLKRKNLELHVAPDDGLDVRNFAVQERLSSLFQVSLVAVSENPSIDFDAVVGQPAHFTLRSGQLDRFWTGLCNHFEQIRVEPSGLSTYQISIVPTLWLLTQRKNHRMFQQMSEPDIVLKVLKEWHIVPELRIDRGAYKKRKYRVQYAESDFAFISRMLEDAGITFYFEQSDEETKLVLSDAPQANKKRELPLLFADDTSTTRNHDTGIVTNLRMRQRVRPGKYTLQDHDYRRPPSYKLVSSASGGSSIEDKLERYEFASGAFNFGTTQGDTTPVADDKGKTRTDEKEAAILAQKRLDAKRGSARVCTFETSAHDLAPGVVIRIEGHPNSALGDGRSLLVVESSLNGTDQGEWRHTCEARGTEAPFRPEQVTPRPKVNGVESATVVGPKGDEIHTDEFGRVRVHFHWDRESKMDENSSCWIPVSQSWAGAGYGGINLPRKDQEVLVDFLGGDPDRPVIVGRLYTNLQKVPYTLPGHKTQSGWKSQSTGGSGGYNEIMFEDAGGQELVRMQAEKDLHKLVKHDEQQTVGRDRTRTVKRNESVTVGGNRTKRVKLNEQQVVGLNQSVTVGANRSTQVGMIDSTIVGASHVVMILPPGEWLKEDGSTSLLMKDKKIVLDTGAGASITMDGSSITLAAATITLEASAFLGAMSTGVAVVGGVASLILGSPAMTAVTGGALVSVASGGLCSVTGKGDVSVSSTAGDVVIKGGPLVKINS